MWPPGDPAHNPAFVPKLSPKYWWNWTVTNCALMAQNCPLSRIKISAKESCRRRYLLPFIRFKVSHERNPFLAPIRAIFCISNPPAASLALYTGWSFVSPLISSIICPVAMKEYLHLALTVKGESLISHKIAIKLLKLPIQHQIWKIDGTISTSTILSHQENLGWWLNKSLNIQPWWSCSASGDWTPSE